MNDNASSSSATSRPLSGLPKRALRSTTKAALVAASSSANNSSPALDARMTSLSLDQRLQYEGSSPRGPNPTTPSNARKTLLRLAPLRKKLSLDTKVADPCTPTKRVRFSGTPPPAPMRRPLGKPPKAASTSFPRMKMPGCLKESNEKKRKRDREDDE